MLETETMSPRERLNDLPHDQDAEMRMTSYFLSHPDRAPKELGIKEDCFYFTQPRKIFRAIVYFQKSNRPIECVEIGKWLDQEGDEQGESWVSWIFKIIDIPCQDPNGTAQRLKDLYSRRQAIAHQEAIKAACYNEDIPLEDVLESSKKTTEELLSFVAESRISDEEGRIFENDIHQYYRDLPDGIHFDLTIEGQEIIFPIGGYSVFAAPTKHGKTRILVNSAYNALTIDPSLEIAFFTLEELAHPILIRFLNCHLNTQLSQNNHKTLAHFYKHQAGSQWQMFSDGADKSLFLERRDSFFKTICPRIRMFDLSCDGGLISTIEHLCSKIKALHKINPQIKAVFIDYLQLINIQKSYGKPREETLKEICLQLKDCAAMTGLAIVTAAQFNRQVLKEEDMLPQAIGEGGAVERHASLAIGLWNRTFPQFASVGKPTEKEQKEELFLKVMLNRYGTANISAEIPFNGNLGKIDLSNAGNREKPSPIYEKTYQPPRSFKSIG